MHWKLWESQTLSGLTRSIIFRTIKSAARARYSDLSQKAHRPSSINYYIICIKQTLAIHVTNNCYAWIWCASWTVSAKLPLDRIDTFCKAGKPLMCRTCALTSNLTKLLLTSRTFRSRSLILCHSSFLETKPRYFLRSQTGHCSLSKSQTRILCSLFRRIIMSALATMPISSKSSTHTSYTAYERHCISARRP